MKGLLKISLSAGALLLTGCGGGPVTSSHNISDSSVSGSVPPSLSTLAQQNRFVMTVPTKDNNNYLVVKDMGNGNREIQLWSNDLKRYIKTLLKIDQGYDVEALYVTPDHHFISIIRDDTAPSDVARIVSIDYNSNQIIANTNIYNLSQDYRNNIYYDNATDTLMIGDSSIPIHDLQDNYQIDTSNYSNNHSYSTGEWVDSMNQWYDQTDQNGYQDSDYSTGSTWANSDTNDYSHSTGEWVDSMNQWNAQNSQNNYQDADYSTGSEWANSNSSSAAYDPSIDAYLDALYEANKDSVSDPQKFAELIEELKNKNYNGTLQASDVNEVSNYLSNNTYMTSMAAEQNNYQPNTVTIKRGTWRGVGHQFWQVNMDYDIKLSISDNEYYFTYVDSTTTCYGSLTVLSVDSNSVTFQEHLNGGQCVENYFVLTKIDDNHFSYDSYLSSTGEHTVTGDVYFSSSSFE